jgi:Icc-related predicted phosphoesterase
MKILIASDFHGKISIIDSIVETFREMSPDIISFCGDIVQGGARIEAWLKRQAEGKTPEMDSTEIRREAEEDSNTYQNFFLSLDTIGVPIIVVPGNMDAPESNFFRYIFNYEMTLKHIRLVQENIFYYDEFFFSGFGGEITKNQSERDFVLQYPVENVRFSLRKLFYVMGKKILLFHTPPKSKLDFERGKHKGCDCVNELIEWLEPDFAFCGHAHNARGEEWLGKTLVINPGPLNEGFFALLDTEGPNVRLEKIKL